MKAVQKSAQIIYYPREQGMETSQIEPPVSRNIQLLVERSMFYWTEDKARGGPFSPILITKQLCVAKGTISTSELPGLGVGWAQ